MATTSKKRQSIRNAKRKEQALLFLWQQEIVGQKVGTTSTILSTYLWDKLWADGLIVKEDGPIASYWVLSDAGRLAAKRLQ